ncbi:MAG TPA: flagellar basal body L-ring protein FlgH [Acetomicrobium flavidum]|uniref:flagellar basal body L-ring protein FlgH n=1 Tax=Acetomicrobium flavidum TaxID=49896 RepID=UPI002BDBDBBC|nr:flagellar basal body L-ring protein FlgH [Acetomicrobium flavidum]HOP88005.1 flagellar basal body L-ring protein FlgH [Acetomicrobium flavidum]HPP14411.1 flagellar basal body L-ring protein FlgH [Acetomicrobium flavidum]
MKRHIVIVVVFLILLLACLGGQARAQSLWQDGSNLYADPKPSGVGDIVTVIVEESIGASDKAKTDLTKDIEHEVDDGTGIFDFIRKFGVEANTDMSGDSSSSRTYSLKTRVSCIVTEVQDNGNLVIEGYRDLKTHDENLKLTLRGVIRPRDVSYDNTISSTKVANPELLVEGKGSLSRVQKPGLITQILQALF